MATFNPKDKCFGVGKKQTASYTMRVGPNHRWCSVGQPKQRTGRRLLLYTRRVGPNRPLVCGGPTKTKDWPQIVVCYSTTHAGRARPTRGCCVVDLLFKQTKGCDGYPDLGIPFLILRSTNRHSTPRCVQPALAGRAAQHRLAHPIHVA